MANQYLDELSTNDDRSILRSPEKPVAIGNDFALGAMFCQDLVRDIFDSRNVHLTKVTILRMSEQRKVICFLLKDALAAIDIPGRLIQVSGQTP
jgi:hypothetical protein